MGSSRRPGIGLDLVPGYRVYGEDMRTSEVAAAADVNPQTLRYYERRGLLPQPGRTRGGYRAYGHDAVKVVRFVKRAQRLGFTLDDVEALLHLADGGPDGCDAARGLAVERIADLDRRIGELRAMRVALGRLVATCEQPRAERECPLLRALAADAEQGDEGHVPRRPLKNVVGGRRWSGARRGWCGVVGPGSWRRQAVVAVSWRPIGLRLTSAAVQAACSRALRAPM